MSTKKHTTRPLDELGGKAHGLQLLGQMGYTVPDYFVVPFSQSISDPELVQSVKAFASKHAKVAVRSSANIEDGEQTSFAGLFESYLDIAASEIVSSIEAVRNSQHAERVVKYCEAMGLSAADIKMNVIVQQFDEPSRSGVWMGNGALGGRLEWTEGRGDQIVDGQVVPNFETYDAKGSLASQNTKELLVDQTGRPVAEMCKGMHAKLGYDADLEFCITGSGLQWLQLRRVTRKIDASGSLNAPVVQQSMIKGEAASPYTASGTAYRLDQHHGEGWGSGNVLVARATSPNDMMYIMTSVGVVTKMGGMLSHSAVVCRELGKACVVGVDIDKIQHGAKVSIDGIVGEVILL